MTGVVAHFAPHPDDELIGAPATLLALRDAGWRVVNVACGLGRPEQRARRREELQEACCRAGFELLLPSAPPLDDEEADGAAVGARLVALVEETLTNLAPPIVVSPTLSDRHPSHERVALAVRDGLRGSRQKPPRWWAWAVWGSLPKPTLGVGFNRSRLDEVLAALGAHRGELERNDYRWLVEGRAAMNASLAPELLFGFGTAALADAPYAELLDERVLSEGGWTPGRPRWLDPKSPLG